MFDISVIVPTYNNAYFLNECIESIIQQTHRLNFEIIIIDDATTNQECLGILDELKGSEFKLIRRKINKGVQAARNIGVKNSIGKYIVCLDADDVFLASTDNLSYLETAVEMLEQDNQMAFVHTLSEMFGDFSGLTISSYPLTEEMALRKHHIPTSIVYRKEEFDFGTKYYEEVPKWQDWAFGITLLSNRWLNGKSNKIGFFRGPGHGYRIHSRVPRISKANLSELDSTLTVIKKNRKYFHSFFSNSLCDQNLAKLVLNSKPSKLKDLLHVCRYDFETAINIMGQRDFYVKSDYWSDFDIP